MERTGIYICGIAGVRRYADEPINWEELRILMCSLEHRGNHSTGMTLLNGDQLFTLKDHVPAWSFCAAKETLAFVDEHLTEETSIALLHTRFATVGNPSDNNNNHPITDGETAIVHNGSISNHTWLFGDEKVERNCETDSDIIRALLSKHGFTEAGLNSLSRMTGSAAIAAVSTVTPDLLVLGRSGSPLAYGADDNKLWWASELGAVQKAVKPWANRHGLYVRTSRPKVGFFTMPDNTVYILGPEGINLRREMKVCTHYNAPTYAGMRDNYGSRMRSYIDEGRRAARTAAAAAAIKALPAPMDEDAKKVARCPTCQKAWAVPKSVAFKGFYCNNVIDGKKCGTDLAPLDDIKDL